MSGGREVKIIPARTPESKQFVADVERAMAITPALNRLTYADADQVRSLFEELAGQTVGDHFRLVPPFYTDCGKNIRVATLIEEGEAGIAAVRIEVVSVLRDRLS